MNNKYTRTNWKTENNGQKTRKQNKVEAPWLHSMDFLQEIASNQFGQLSSYHINLGTISRIYISFKQTYHDSVPFELRYLRVCPWKMDYLYFFNTSQVTNERKWPLFLRILFPYFLRSIFCTARNRKLKL